MATKYKRLLYMSVSIVLSLLIIPVTVSQPVDKPNISALAKGCTALARANLRRVRREKIPALVGEFRDEDEKVREDAARALAHLGGFPVELLPDLVRDIEGGDADARRRAIWVLGGMEEEGAKVLIKMLCRPAQNEENYWIYTKSFRTALMARRHREFAISSLIAAMDSADARLRVRSAIYLWWTYEGLTHFGEQDFAARAIPILIQGLKHEDTDIREFSAIALGEMAAGRYYSGDTVSGALDIGTLTMQNIVSALIEALDDKDDRAQGRVIGALYYIGSPARDAIPAIIEILDHEDHLDAVRALGRIGKSDREIVSTLIRMLDDENRGSEFRVCVIQSLRGMLWDDNSLSEYIIPVFIRLLGDTDAEVRACAAGNLRGKKYAEQTVPALIRKLSDDDPKMREYAVNALKHIDTPEAREAVKNYE